MNPPAYPSTSVAYIGTGFTGFGTYGDSIGSAEALAQNLSQSLLPGNVYTLSLVAIKAYAGSYASNCGSIEIYGFENTAPNNEVFIHPSQFPGAILLAATPLIQDTSWQLHTLNLTVSDTVNSLLFTITLVPNCKQYIFIDHLLLTVDTSGTNSIFNHLSQKFEIFPNPSNGHVQVFNETIIEQIAVYNITGSLITECAPNSYGHSLKLEEAGVYFVYVTANGVMSYQKLVIVD